MFKKWFGLYLFITVSSIFSMGVQPGQKLTSIQFTGAAVLPIVQWEKTGQDNEVHKTKYLLVSREAAGWDRGTWDTFGGSRDAHETNPLDTAAREFEEEGITAQTLDLDYAAVRNFIDPENGNTKMVLAKYMDDNGNQGTPRFYVLYLTEFSHKSIKAFREKFFQARAKAASPKYQEKDGIALVRWDDLEKAIKDNPSSMRIQVVAHEFDPETKKNKPMKSMINLRPLMVKVLRPYMQENPYVQGENDKTRFYK